MKEARLYERLESGLVRCYLCRHNCKIKDGKKGICAVRLNEGGTLYSLVYDKVVSTNVDPIEKKPLFHVAPGSLSFSMATVGCNFRCSFCQNHSISQMPLDEGRIVGEAIPPAKLAQFAKSRGCRSIAYTYTEPTIYYELARDTMVEAKKLDILNVFVTNGYMTREMLDDCKGLLDAANVDLKSFSAGFYTEHTKGRREGVLDTLRYMKELGIWVEVTTLLIPDLNDDMDEVRNMARFLKNELGEETPWHVSRFHPQYKEMDRYPTEVRAIQQVRQIGLDEGLQYVYTGNVPRDAGEKTYCPKCSATVIDRVGYSIKANEIKNGQCPECGADIAGLEL